MTGLILCRVSHKKPKQTFAWQALGGPTRSQKANQAWADAAAKLRNPDALNRITIPEGTRNYAFKNDILPENVFSKDLGIWNKT